MHDAMRLYFGARSLLGFPPPHRPKAPLSTPSRGATGVSAPSVDTFEHIPGRATLHHHRCSYLPLDPGVPKLDDSNGESFAAPPLDLDELAACAGQSRMFGPLVGRLIMAVGSYFALYATVQAASALCEDGPQVDALAAARQRFADKPQSLAMRALQRLFGQEIAERERTQRANWLLLPGALGMSVNLLGSAELLGHFLPVLQPVAALAMAPAAVCMALYGSYIAYTSVTNILASRSARAARASALRPEGITAEVWQKMQRRDSAREAGKCRWDAALATSGGLQAVGALAQWAIGPVWLLALLPGTVGLMVFKLLRVKSYGQHTVSPQLQPETRDLDLPLGRVVHHHTLARRRRKHLRTMGGLAGGDGTALRHRLAQAVAQSPSADMRLVRALQGTGLTAQSEAELLVRATAALGVFPYLAEAVARARHLPRTRNAVEEKNVSYTITGGDIVHLVASAPAPEQARVLQRLRAIVADVGASYGAAVALQDEVLMAELEGAMVEALPA